MAAGRLAILPAFLPSLSTPRVPLHSEHEGRQPLLNTHHYPRVLSKTTLESRYSPGLGGLSVPPTRTGPEESKHLFRLVAHHLHLTRPPTCAGKRQAPLSITTGHHHSPSHSPPLINSLQTHRYGETRGSPTKLYYGLSGRCRDALGKETYLPGSSSLRDLISYYLYIKIHVTKTRFVTCILKECPTNEKFFRFIEVSRASDSVHSTGWSNIPDIFFSYPAYLHSSYLLPTFVILQWCMPSWPSSGIVLSTRQGCTMNILILTHNPKQRTHSYYKNDVYKLSLSPASIRCTVTLTGFFSIFQAIVT